MTETNNQPQGVVTNRVTTSDLITLGDRNSSESQASSSNVYGQVEIQRLKGSNWSTWKWQLQNVLDAKGLTNVLTSSETQFQMGHPKEVATRQILSSSLDSSLISKVIHCATAQQIWSCLCGIYENRTSFALTDLIGRMNSYKMKNLDEVESGVSAIQSMACSIKALGGIADNSTIESAILRALPRSFQSFVTSWSFLESEKRTLENLHAHLMRTVCILRSNDISESKERALVAQQSKTSDKTKNIQGSPQNRDAKRNNLFCKYCKKTNHLVKDCRKLAKKKKETNAESSPDKQEVAKPQPEQVTQEKSPKTEDSQASARVAYGLIATIGKSHRCLKASTDSKFTTSYWIADSGASFHMTSHFEWLAGYVELTDKFPVRLGDDREVMVHGKGFIETTSGILEPVFYLPEISDNLFSVASCARTHKIFALSTDESMISLKDDKEVFRGNLTDNGIYEIEFTVKLARHVALLAANLEDWHDKLSHISPNVIKYMANHHIVDGIVITNKIDDICEYCAAGKCHRSTHPCKTTKRAEKPGQTLHFDTVGPMPVVSLGGSRYYILCKDSYSSYRFVFFTETKSEIVDGLKKIITKAKLETGNDVLSVVSDNGTEYLNSRLKIFLDERGINHTTSAVYTPQQNGLVERDIRTVSEASRTIRIKANLPKEFWAEAVNTSIYTLNRVINSRNKEKTPFELWHNRKPSLNNLHTFGEMAYVLKPENTKDKLDPKGNRLIFTGYTDIFNTFRFIDPETNQLTISSNAVFLGKLITEKSQHEQSYQENQETVTVNITDLSQYDPLSEDRPQESLQPTIEMANEFAGPSSSSASPSTDETSLDEPISLIDGSMNRTFDVTDRTFDITDLQEASIPAQPDPERIASLRPRDSRPCRGQIRTNGFLR